MSNNYFNFKQFTIQQGESAFKVGTDGVLLGATTNTAGVKRILDIGSGTGLIAIMMAQRSDAEIIAIEPDIKSFAECCENVARCKWNKRIKVENTCLQDYFPAEMKFDLIVSNPPYFSESLKCADPRKSLTRHNDSLSSGDLLDGVIRLLEENGRFCVILPYIEGNIFIAEAGMAGLYCNSILKIRPVLNGEVRRLILCFSRLRTNVSEKFLTIEKGCRFEFTEEYIDITKDFYLKF
jgi:tRNA1Val (adenine37-N6)-methyltransferase